MRTAKALASAAGVVVALVGIGYLIQPGDPEPEPAPMRIEWVQDDGLWVEWNPNPEPTPAGYRVHWGTRSGVYTEIIDVGNRLWARLPVYESPACIALTAYDATGVDSPFSDELEVLPEHIEPRRRLRVTPARVPGTNSDGTRSLWPVPVQTSTDCVDWGDTGHREPFWVPTWQHPRMFFRPQPGWIPHYDREGSPPPDNP